MKKKVIAFSLLVSLVFSNSCATIIKNTDLVEKNLVDTKSELKKELKDSKINYSQELENGRLKINFKKENTYLLNQMETKIYSKNLGTGWKIAGGAASLVVSFIGISLIPIWNGDKNTSTAIVAGSAAGITLIDQLLSSFVSNEEKKINPITSENNIEVVNPDGAFVTLTTGDKILTDTTDKNGNAYFSPVLSDGNSSDDDVLLSISENNKDSNFKFPLRKEIYAYFKKNSKQTPVITKIEKTEPVKEDKQTVIDKTPPFIVITYPEVTRGLKVVFREEKITIIGKVIDESGITNVAINGSKVTLMENGNFRADVTLKKGDNEILINAEDNYRNKTDYTFQITKKDESIANKEYTENYPPTDKINIKGNYYAVLIGINNYKSLSKLQTAVNDAKDLSEILKTTYGFKTTLFLDNQATRANIMNELNDLRKKLAPEDKLLVYYAGHGSFDNQTSKAYWLPVDANPDNDTEWIIADSITSGLKRILAKHILIVSDSCYSGTLTRSLNTELSSYRIRVSYINKILDKETRILISSGGNEPVADSGGEKHSVFAQAFLEGLKSMNDQIFTAEEFFVKQLRESVAGKSEQTPEYKIITNSGHDGGDFVFRRVK